MDMVCMVPIVNLDADILLGLWEKVLEVLTVIGFDVVCNSVDGHLSNRKFYVEKLCNGQLRVCIPHPYKENEWIYLLFDQVHVFKCIYNNFVNKKHFICPNFNGLKIDPYMQHIKELYKLELGKPVKYAYKLSDKVLHPMPIEKTNVNLADCLFHESTINALEYYAKMENLMGKILQIF